MSVFIDISAALDSHLNDLVGKPPIAWENKEYTPTRGTLYARPTLIPAETTQATLGDSGTDVTTGIYQVDVFAPAGEGKNAGLTMADTIANHFKRGTDLTYNSRVVRIRNTGRRQALNNAEGWYQIIVEIGFIAYTQPRT